jgi:hypothetical protein
MPRVFTKTVVAGDGLSYVVSGVGDYNNCAMLEVPAAYAITTEQGSGDGASSTASTAGPLTAQAAGAYRDLLVEWDGQVGAEAPSGWTLMSPPTWDSSSSSGHHSADVWSIPATTSGSPAMTTANMENGQAPVWQTLNIAPPVVVVPPLTTMRMVQGFAQVVVGSFAVPSRVRGAQLVA